MDIYAHLKADHKDLKSLLKRLEETTEKAAKTREQLLEKLKALLVPHARAEEKVLYDRMKSSAVEQADELAFEGYEEHAVVDGLMEKLAATDPADKKWTALMTVVQESLEHHIKEEEEEIFEKARKSFEPAEALLMGEEFVKLKGRFREQVKAGETPAQPPSHELVA